jgi:phosphatidylglycerol:prolipoprotein diacylglycerol transferase
MIMLGVLAATFLVSVEAKRRGQNPEVLWDMLIWIVIAGIIGARIWHILTPPPSMIAEGITTQYYLTYPLAMIDIRNGGLGIPGAVFGGALAMWIYTRRKKLNFATWLDLVAPGLALAQAIAGATSSTRSSMALPRTCPGSSTSIQPIAYPVTRA